MVTIDGFNANDYEPQDFDVLPAGEYMACIVDSEMKPTKKGDGQILNLTLQVMEGQYKNRKFWERINYLNPSAKAQKIGRGTLSAICRATGILSPSDTSELHNKPMKVKLKVKNDPQYGQSNEVSKYSSAVGTTAAMTAAAEQQLNQQATQPAQQTAPPTGQAASASAWAAQAESNPF